MTLTEHTNEQGYQDWLNQLKIQIRSSQQRAILAVNQELVLLYWQIGQNILQRQTNKAGVKLLTDYPKTYPLNSQKSKVFYSQPKIYA